MAGPINRVQPSNPMTVNALERYKGHLIKLDSEGLPYWTRPDSQASVLWRTVEAVRADIDRFMEGQPAAPVADINDVDVEVA